MSLCLTWRIPGTAEPGGLPSTGSQRVGHDWSDLAGVAVAACLTRTCALQIPIFVSDIYPLSTWPWMTKSLQGRWSYIDKTLVVKRHEVSSEWNLYTNKNKQIHNNEIILEIQVLSMRELISSSNFTNYLTDKCLMQRKKISGQQRRSFLMWGGNEIYGLSRWSSTLINQNM